MVHEHTHVGGVLFVFLSFKKQVNYGICYLGQKQKSKQHGDTQGAGIPNNFPVLFFFF